MVTAEPDDDSDNDCLYIDEGPTEPDNTSSGSQATQHVNTSNLPENSSEVPFDLPEMPSGVPLHLPELPSEVLLHLPEMPSEVPIDPSDMPEIDLLLTNEDIFKNIPYKTPDIPKTEATQREDPRITCKDFSQKPFDSPLLTGSALFHYLTTDCVPLDKRNKNNPRAEGIKDLHNSELKQMLDAPSRPPINPYKPVKITARRADQIKFIETPQAEKETRIPPNMDDQNQNQMHVKEAYQANQTSVIVPHPGILAGGAMAQHQLRSPTSQDQATQRKQQMHGYPVQNSRPSRSDANGPDSRIETQLELYGHQGAPYKSCELDCPCRTGSSVPLSPLIPNHTKKLESPMNVPSLNQSNNPLRHHRRRSGPLNKPSLIQSMNSLSPQDRTQLGPMNMPSLSPLPFNPSLDQPSVTPPLHPQHQPMNPVFNQPSNMRERPMSMAPSNAQHQQMNAAFSQRRDSRESPMSMAILNAQHQQINHPMGGKERAMDMPTITRHHQPLNTALQHQHSGKGEGLNTPPLSFHQPTNPALNFQTNESNDTREDMMSRAPLHPQPVMHTVLNHQPMGGRVCAPNMPLWYPQHEPTNSALNINTSGRREGPANVHLLNPQSQPKDPGLNLQPIGTRNSPANMPLLHPQHQPLNSASNFYPTRITEQLGMASLNTQSMTPFSSQHQLMNPTLYQHTGREGQMNWPSFNPESDSMNISVRQNALLQFSMNPSLNLRAIRDGKPINVSPQHDSREPPCGGESPMNMNRQYQLTNISMNYFHQSIDPSSDHQTNVRDGNPINVHPRTMSGSREPPCYSCSVGIPCNDRIASSQSNLQNIVPMANFQTVPWNNCGQAYNRNFSMPESMYRGKEINKAAYLAETRTQAYLRNETRDLLSSIVPLNNKPEVKAKKRAKNAKTPRKAGLQKAKNTTTSINKKAGTAVSLTLNEAASSEAITPTLPVAPTGPYPIPNWEAFGTHHAITKKLAVTNITKTTQEIVGQLDIGPTHILNSAEIPQIDLTMDLADNPSVKVTPHIMPFALNTEHMILETAETSTTTIDQNVNKNTQVSLGGVVQSCPITMNLISNGATTHLIEASTSSDVNNLIINSEQPLIDTKSEEKPILIIMDKKEVCMKNAVEEAVKPCLLEATTPTKNILSEGFVRQTSNGATIHLMEATTFTDINIAKIDPDKPLIDIKSDEVQIPLIIDKQDMYMNNTVAETIQPSLLKAEKTTLTKNDQSTDFVKQTSNGATTHLIETSAFSDGNNLIINSEQPVIDTKSEEKPILIIMDKKEVCMKNTVEEAVKPCLLEATTPTKNILSEGFVQQTSNGATIHLMEATTFTDINIAKIDPDKPLIDIKSDEVQIPLIIDKQDMYMNNTVAETIQPSLLKAEKTTLTKNDQSTDFVKQTSNGATTHLIETSAFSDGNNAKINSEQLLIHTKIVQPSSLKAKIPNKNVQCEDLVQQRSNAATTHLMTAYTSSDINNAKTNSEKPLMDIKSDEGHIAYVVDKEEMCMINTFEETVQPGLSNITKNNESKNSHLVDKEDACMKDTVEETEQSSLLKSTTASSKNDQRKDFVEQISNGSTNHLLEASTSSDFNNDKINLEQPLIDTKSDEEHIPLNMDKEDMCSKITAVKTVQPSSLKATATTIMKNVQDEDDFVHQTSNNIDVEAALAQLHGNIDEAQTNIMPTETLVQLTQAYEIMSTTSFTTETPSHNIESNNVIVEPQTNNAEIDETKTSKTVSIHHIIENTVTLSVVHNIVTNQNIPLPETKKLLEIMNMIRQRPISTKTCTSTDETANNKIEEFNDNIDKEEEKADIRKAMEITMSENEYKTKNSDTNVGTGYKNKTVKNLHDSKDDEKLKIARQKLARLLVMNQLENSNKCTYYNIKTEADDNYQNETKTERIGDKIPPITYGGSSVKNKELHINTTGKKPDIIIPGCKGNNILPHHKKIINNAQEINKANNSPKNTNVLPENETDNVNSQELSKTSDSTENKTVSNQIDEMVFFKFQINFFRLVQERLTENNYLQLAKKVHNDILDLITLCEEADAKADIKYQCHMCNKVSTYSPRIFYYYASDFLASLKYNVKMCPLCVTFTKKYIEVLIKYIARENGNTDNVNNQITENSVKRDYTTAEPINERKTFSQTLLNNDEDENTNKQDKHCNNKEEQSLRTDDAPPSLKLVNTVEQDNNYEKNGVHQTNFIVKLPRYMIKESIIQTLLQSKNAKSNDNKSSRDEALNIALKDGKSKVRNSEEETNRNKSISLGTNNNHNKETKPKPENKKSSTTKIDISDKNPHRYSNKRKSVSGENGSNPDAAQENHPKKKKSNTDTARNKNATHQKITTATVLENKNNYDKNQDRQSENPKSIIVKTASEINPDTNNTNTDTTLDDTDDKNKNQEKHSKKTNSKETNTKIITRPEGHKQNCNVLSGNNDDNNNKNRQKQPRKRKSISAGTAPITNSESNNTIIKSHHIVAIDMSQKSHSKKTTSIENRTETITIREGLNQSSNTILVNNNITQENQPKTVNHLSSETAPIRKPEADNTIVIPGKIDAIDKNQEKHLKSKKRKHICTGTEMIPSQKTPKLNFDTALHRNEDNDKEQVGHSKKRKSISTEATPNKSPETINRNTNNVSDSTEKNHEMHSKKRKSISAETSIIASADDCQHDKDKEKQRITIKISCGKIITTDKGHSQNYKEDKSRPSPASKSISVDTATDKGHSQNDKEDKSRPSPASKSISVDTATDKKTGYQQRKTIKARHYNSTSNKKESYYLKTSNASNENHDNVENTKGKTTTSEDAGLNIPNMTPINKKDKNKTALTCKPKKSVKTLEETPNIQGKNKNATEKLNKVIMEEIDFSKSNRFEKQNNNVKKQKKVEKDPGEEKDDHFTEDDIAETLNNCFKILKENCNSSENIDIFNRLIKTLNEKPTNALPEVKISGKKEENPKTITKISFKYICRHCSVSFRSEDLCKSHVAEDHKKKKVEQNDYIQMRKCSFCPNKYVKPKLYDKHVKTYHEEIYKRTVEA